MKSSLYKNLIILFLTFSVSSMMAQFSSVNNVKDFCIKSLKTNNIDDFVSTFSDPIEISLPDQENSYSKVQAGMVIRKFLNNNKVDSFTKKQSGKSTGGSEFIIGNMKSVNGQEYQIYFLFTMIDNKAFLHLIEFELL
ncbi:MAG: hypothetical protein DRI86_12240 [Bacteroidetes bacterium]|nr:MAG: hypothetical protein DRI86_12240 [Bacteroidota bacterium]